MVKVLTNIHFINYCVLSYLRCVLRVVLQTNTYIKTFKGGLQRLLRIGSAHNNGGHLDLKIAQISHVSNFSEHKL